MESFGGSFFKVYSDELYRYCGYETETPGFARVWVARPDLFMVYMGAMMRAGIIEDCSFARMAGHVDRIFDTGNTENTVLNKLKEQLPEADSIVDGMKAEFKNFKSRNKNKPIGGVIWLLLRVKGIENLHKIVFLIMDLTLPL